MQTQCQPPDHANWHGLWVRGRLPSTSPSPFVIITHSESWYSIYLPMDGGRLSRPRHCCKGAQPVPKAVYRSGCRDKYKRLRWDSNLGPLTPQSDALTTWPLRPAVVGRLSPRPLASTPKITVVSICPRIWPDTKPSPAPYRNNLTRALNISVCRQHCHPPTT